MPLSFAKTGRRFRILDVTEGTGQSTATQQANFAEVRAAVSTLHSGETGTLLVESAAVEFYYGAAESIGVPEGAHLLVLRRAGGHLHFFPNFAPHVFYAFTLDGRTSRISFLNAGVFEAWAHGPVYPYLLHPIQVQYTPGSNVLTRVAGETRAFSSAMHLGRTAYANYFDAAGNLQSIDTTVTAVNSADEIEIAAAIPGTAQASPASWPRVGIDLDSALYAAVLVSEGGYWSRRPLTALVYAQVAGAHDARGRIMGKGLFLGGKFQMGLAVDNHAADVLLSGCELTAHETVLQLFATEDELTSRPHLYRIDTVLRGGGYVPLGRTSAYYSETHGHALYMSPNFDHLAVATAPGASQVVDSGGSYKLYSETGIAQESRLNEMVGETFTDVEEGWTPTTSGWGVARDCTFTRTAHFAADNLRMIGGTMEDAQILRIRGIFGAGDASADKMRHYKGVQMSFHYPGALVTDGLDYTGEQRTLLEDCTVTIDVPLGYDYDLWLQTGDPGALRVLELRGGVYTAMRLRRLARLVAGMTLRLTGGVRLIGEPTAGYWVQLAGGTLEAVDVDLSGTSTPLTL